MAGRLHDLGKLAVPREILHKEGPLSAAERHVLERHTEIGSRMVESIGLGPAAPWVLHHHERWDGAGYPAGLHGEEIPLGARIIFVAGAFDSMTSDTVYRAALTRTEALDEVHAAAGTQFDPRWSTHSWPRSAARANPRRTIVALPSRRLPAFR